MEIIGKEKKSREESRVYGEYKWILLHDKLLTNLQRVTRGLVVDAFCPGCNVVVEDVNHMLCGCSCSCVV